MKILVVDDQKIQRSLLKKLLTKNGHEITTSKNGEEALKELKKNQFKLIISDILMPVMDGYQLCQKVKNDKVLNQIPFVFYTATYIDKEDENLALKLGADLFIRKDTKQEKFLAAIQQMLQDVEEGNFNAKKMIIENEKEVFKLYSERLIKKLEKKMINLENEVKIRKKAERELKKYYNQMEFIVDERTTELTHINIQLQQEINERKRFEEALKNSKNELERRVKKRTKELSKANKQLKHEINERKQAQEELVKEKEKAQIYLDIASVMIVVVNADQTIGLVNNKGCEILGYDYEEIIGKNWFEHFIPERNRKKTLLFFKKLLKNNQELVEYHENPILTKDGDERLIAWHNALVKDNKGNIIGTLSSGQDITERKKSQELIILTEKMMTVAGLAAGMAHEINNPLAAILQSAQVIQNRITQNLPINKEKAQESGTHMKKIITYLKKRKIENLLETIMESCKRAAAIVDNMLSFSRKSESHFAFHSIIDLFDKIIALAESEYDLKKKYDFRKIKIIKEYSNGIPQVYCDGIRIQQVILNLLKNAAQAMFQAKIKNPQISIKLKTDNNMLIIQIKDNGPGIPEHILKRIFEPFFTTKKAGIGTGLGLSVSYFIITENHQGKMEVLSSIDKGTTFIIHLPLNKINKEKNQ